MRESSRPAWVIGLVAVAAFMVSLDILVVTTALAEIRTDLDASVGALEWTMTSYNVCLAALMLMGFALGDRYGRRRMFMVGIAVFTAGSVVCAVAPTIETLIAGRTLQGVGAALIAPLELPLIAAVIPDGQRGRALGIVAGVNGLAPLAGPMLGGAIATTLGWQWIFWANVPVGLALLVLVRRHVAETRGPDRPLDVPGAALAAAAMAAVAWGLSHAADAGITAPEVAVALLVGLALGTGFVLRERYARHPMIDLGLLRSRVSAAINLAAACHSVLVIGAVFVMAQFLQAALGVDSLGAGLRLLPWTGTMVLVGPLAGRLADRFSPNLLAAGGLGVASLGYAWLALVATEGVTYAALVAPLLVVGIANSAVFPAISTAVASSVAPDQVGAAAGINTTVRQVGSVLGIALAALAFTTAGSFDTPAGAASGFRAASLLFVTLGLVGALTSVTAHHLQQNTVRRTCESDHPAGRIAPR